MASSVINNTLFWGVLPTFWVPLETLFFVKSRRHAWTVQRRPNAVSWCGRQKLYVFADIWHRKDRLNTSTNSFEQQRERAKKKVQNELVLPFKDQSWKASLDMSDIILDDFASQFLIWFSARFLIFYF